MNKIFLLLLCSWLTLCVGYQNAVAQTNCTDYAAGPYTDQGAIGIASCTNGSSVVANYQAWENEVYSSNVIAGGNYTVSLGAPGNCSNTAWGDPVTITVIQGGTPTDDAAPAGGPGSIVGGTILASAQACSVPFTPTATGTVYFIFSTTTSCNGAIGNVDNGTPTVTTVDVVCPICDNGTCDAGESYCNCGQGGGDCPCTADDIDVQLIGINPATGGLAVATAGDPSILRCQSDFTTGTPPAEQTVYVTMAYFGGACLGQTDGANPPVATSPWVTATSNFGTVVNAPGTPLTIQPQLFIFFLELTQAQINASGGTVNITFADETAGSNCSLPYTINLAAWGNTATLVADNCVPCLDNAGTLTGPTQVCYGETFNITSVGATFDPTSAADGVLYGLFTADGPTVGSENDVLGDANFIAVLGDDTNPAVTNTVTAGGDFVIAPITYEGVDATSGNYLLGDCHHVGTGFDVSFIPEITLDGFLDCNLEVTLSGGSAGSYNYTLSGPSPATTQVDAGTTTSNIVYAGAAGDYALVVTDATTGCTETFTVSIAPNNDSAGDASSDGATSIVVCYDGTYTIMSEGAVVGSDDQFFSNVLGWGISTADPAGDIDAVDVAFIRATSSAQILNFINDGAPLTGAFNPNGTPFTGSLTPGNTYYFTPFTMFDLPGTQLGIETAGDEFGWQGVNGGEASGDAAGTIDLAYTFYVDGANPTGAGFSIDNICFDITHTYIGDVAIYLFSPAGTIIQLIADDGGNSGDDLIACFRATGADPTAGCNGANPPCFTNDLASLESLSLPAGENPNGFWTIIIDDTWGDAAAADGGGTVNNWTVAATGGSLWTGAGNFPFPVWDGTCYLAGNSVEVTLGTEISATATPAACGFTATYQAVGDVTWSVTNGGGTVVSNGTGTGGSFNGSVAANGDYTLTLTDSNGCEATSSFTVSGCVTSTCPTISNLTQTLSQACSGSSVTLCADVNLGTFPNASVLFSDGTTSVTGTITGGGLQAIACATINLSNTTCESVIKNYTASFDAATIGTCSNTVLGPLGVTVYPAITATGVNSTCSASVTVNCPNYGVSYSTTGGATGTGTSYTASAGQSGTVTFTVTQAGAPTGCATATATATYNCPTDVCSELDGTQAVATTSICSGGTVTYTTGGVTNNDFTGGTVSWVYNTAAGFDAYTSGTAFTGSLPANTTCSAVTYYIKARLDGVSACQDVSNDFEVMVYPAITATGVNSTCSASVTVNCPNYSVSYSTTGGATGTGTSYTASAGQSGTVTFTVTQAGAPTGCATATATATYNCPTDVCSELDGTQAVATTSICSGGTVTYTTGGVTNNDFTGGTVSWVYSTTAGFDAYTSGTAFTGSLPANTTCSAVTYYIKARLDGVSACQDVSNDFAVMVYPAIIATGVDGTCSASVTVNCAGFAVSYSSPAGSGNGNTLTLTPSSSTQTGTVTFTITQTGAPTSCASATVTANYNCVATVCSTLDGLQDVETTTLCSGSSVTLNNGGVMNGSFSGGSVAWSYSSNASFDPYTEGTAYSGQSLSASGCNPTIYYFKARLIGVSGCTDASDAVAVTVHPNIVAVPVNGSCNAGVNIAGACSNYTISYTTSNGGSGTGASYTVTPSTSVQSGTVTFTITNPALPTGTACGSTTVEATYNCAALACSVLDDNQSINNNTVCSGQGIGYVSGAVINNDFTGGSVAVKYSTDANFDPYTAGNTFTGDLPANTTCEAITYHIKFYLAGVAGCQDVSSDFQVTVYPSISGTVTNSDSETCGLASVGLNCAFSTTWVDSQGNTGIGTTYQPADGAVGSVVFTATQAGGVGNCGTRTFTASYNCSNLVCAELDGTQAVAETAICSGQSLTITTGSVVDNDFPGGSVTWVYSTTSGFNAYSGGTTFSGNLPANTTCSAMTYFVRARLDGATGCQDQSSEFAVMVYPGITATANNGTCSASVAVNCSGFAVSYSSSTGASGTGTSFTPAAGESGTVTFTISQAGAPAACATATATATFNCPLIQCSVLNGLQDVIGSAICSGQSVNVVNGGIIDNSYSGGTVAWSYSTSADFDAYTGTAFNGSLPNNSGCNAVTYYLKAYLNGLAECQDQSEAFEVTVYPAIAAEVVATECSAMVMSNCDYNVSWQNTNTGETGTGGSYSINAGESALIIFTISQAGAPSSCNNLTLFADLNCPEIACTPNNAGTTAVNLMSGNGNAACAGDGFMASATGVQINDPAYAAGFILYSDANNPAGSVIDSNTDGMFVNDGSYPTGQSLYIASAVLAMPFASNFSAECNAISEGKEIVFLDELQIMVIGYECDFNNDTYNALLQIFGGDGNYSVNGMAISGSTYTSSAIANGGAFSFVVTDGAGCSTEISGANTCTASPEPPVANSINSTISVLAGTKDFNLADLTSDPNGDPLTYALVSYTPEWAGTTSFDPATGIISFTPNPGAVGQTVTITYSVSDGIFEPVQGTITVLISNELTCELLAPITFETAVLVDPVAGAYTIYVEPAGGQPETDNSLYTITVDDGMNLYSEQIGYLSIITAGPLMAPQPTFMATVTVTDELGCTSTREVAVTISLAVETLSFRGEVLDNGNLLNWSTASETNNHHFTILRSADGINYVEVGTVLGVGNSNAVNAYNLLDSNAPAGLSYYRLTQTDIDGTTRIAGNLTLTRGTSQLTVIGISPVPAVNTVAISFNHQLGDAVATISDVTGRVVGTQKTNAIDNTNQLQVDVQNYAAGTYFLTLQNANGAITVKFVKQ